MTRVICAGYNPASYLPRGVHQVLLTGRPLVRVSSCKMMLSPAVGE